MKIVINNRCGGFGLSKRATVWLAERGLEIATPDQAEWGFDWSPSEDELPRHHPLLVEVVETLGEKSWGTYAKLRVIEIPDDTDYLVCAYDGDEWIAEAHKTWRYEDGDA